MSALSWGALDGDKPSRRSGKYDIHKLTLDDEATLTACGFVDRDSKVWSRYGEGVREENAFLSEWLEYPSVDWRKSLSDLESNSKYKEYNGAFCEDALHRIAITANVPSKFIAPRCKYLMTNEDYRRERAGKSNKWLDDSDIRTPESKAERYWCVQGNGKGKLMKLGCRHREIRREAFNPQSGDYQEALRDLVKSCDDILNLDDDDDDRRRPSRTLASRDDDDDDADIDNFEEIHGNPRRYRYDPYLDGPTVIPRYIRRFPAHGGGGCGGQNLNVISYQPSLAHTLMTGVAALGGAYLQFKGQNKVDQYTRDITLAAIKANKSVGAGSMLGAGAGAFWGQNGMFPYPGGQMGGGMCGSPPFHTAFTGCMGGMPGQPPMGGCFGGNCGGGIPGGGCPPGIPCGPSGPCMPGMPCGPGGGIVGGGCPPGMPCGGGAAGGCVGSGCMPGGGCAPGYPCSHGLNGALGGGNPNAMYGYNPYSLDYERDRIKQMQDAIERQNRDLQRAQQYNQQLADMKRQMDDLNRRHNQALNGYNGILANSLGPAGAYGNPGAWNGSGGPIAGGCGGGVGGVGGGMCQPCTTIACYPGQSTAYYAPPYVYGNSGAGGLNYGYPGGSSTFNIGFGFRSGYSAVMTLEDVLAGR